MVMVDPQLYRNYIKYYRKEGPLSYSRMNKDLNGIIIGEIIF